MRTFWKFAALAVGTILLVAAIRWVQSGADTQKTDWLFCDRIDWLGLIDLLLTGSAVAASLACGRRQRGWILGVILAVGLVMTALVGVATFTSMTEVDAVLLAFCLSLGLVMVLAGMRRWKLLWLGVAALMGTLPQVMELVSAAGSFMRQ
jgi:hypothetical protein